jgi:hypothetical protein
MDRKILEISCKVNKSLCQIAQEINRSEKWLLDLFMGDIDISDTELKSLAITLNTKPESLKILFNKRHSKEESFTAKAAWLIFDKVLIGAVVLFIALTVQWQYENFSLKREKALSVSNLKSDFVKGNYAQLQSSFISILTIGDELMANLAMGDNDSEKQLEKVARIIKLETEILLYVELLKTNIELAKSGENLLTTITLFPNEETFETRKSLSNHFSNFSFEIQKLLISVSNNEVDSIIKGSFFYVPI